MKTTVLAHLSLLLLTAPMLLAQAPALPAPTPTALTTSLTRFDLEFDGGTPSALIAAIERASRRPLNAIIPVEFADWKLPPLKMKNIDAAQLFRALLEASPTVQERGGVLTQVRYGFRTVENRPADDTSIWFFFVDGALQFQGQSSLTRFWLLTPYLQNGLSVDDITTAIQTAWKMRGGTERTSLSFHEETKLLIAVGYPMGLETVDLALRALLPPTRAPLPFAGPANEPRKVP
jgi:hypothetical protein